MTKMYISPATTVRGIENAAFMEDPGVVIDNSWAQDVDPWADPETDQPVRSPRKSVWDTDEKEEEL